ncbi:short-chain dehydrogenase/reductase SDR [Tolypothrix tenuis PCC 7101]|uniref:Short-chain dehydrogenase/reductase SDR n=1 Tax=Tolypothrix tenuis PCC 7101 TaxID=231146 RepID=A0A1Z4N8G8_9CYAN|nr:SDR family oxidoreductase [Aulosira sp. FACHB-113]BAZ02013.1 short-chain dehydrogenase/reductase SDR [Tolypothrix tenuis PCC 7101]BAZ74063.1 short-chain dehydrogenase/reductase SDR [Aulosira laxa NIES-50]
MPPLTGKVAIITGASRGIGKAIALKLSNNGASVVVNYAGNTAKAEEVVAEITQQGGQAIAIQADISQVAEIERLFDQAIAKFGKVDILVNNAGSIVYKPITEITEADFDKIFAVNVKGTFFACQQAAQKLTEGGRIINFSSSTTALMLPTYSAYVATKGAVEQITRVLAKELGTKKITVNAVSPGPTDTELFRDGKSDEQINRLAQMAALGKLGDVQEIADVVAFLASDEARWITGQNIRVNGGIA